MSDAGQMDVGSSATPQAAASASSVAGSETSFAWSQLLLVSIIPLSAMGAMLNFAPLLPLIREDLGITNTWAGMLTSAALLSHTLLQLPSGQIADTIGIRRSIFLGLSLIGVSIVASGLSATILMLLLSRFTLGVGTAMSFVAGLSLINSLIPAKHRAAAQGIYGGAGNLGVLLVMLFSERLASWLTWRGAFVLEGAVVLALVVVVVVRLRVPTRTARIIPDPWSSTLRQRPLYLLGLAHILTYGVLMALATWMATFLLEQHGIGLEWAGPLSAFLLVSAVAGRGIGGALSRGRERSVILASCLATAVLTALVPLLPGMLLALPALLLLGWSASMPFGAIFSYMSLLTRQGATGRSLSVINFIANVGALIFPPVMGYVLDRTGSLEMGFSLVAAAGLAGTAVVALWLPRAVR